MSGGKPGVHGIYGIGDGFIPEIASDGRGGLSSAIDEVICVESGDAKDAALYLSAAFALCVGISSGANFLGALKVQEELGPDAVVVTVFPDDNKKYLSTDLLRDEPVKDGFLSPDVKLLGFRAFRRVCRTCFDPFERTQTFPLNLSN